MSCLLCECLPFRPTATAEVLGPGSGVPANQGEEEHEPANNINTVAEKESHQTEKDV